MRVSGPRGCGGLVPVGHEQALVPVGQGRWDRAGGPEAVGSCRWARGDGIVPMGHGQALVPVGQGRGLVPIGQGRWARGGRPRTGTRGGGPGAVSALEKSCLGPICSSWSDEVFLRLFNFVSSGHLLHLSVSSPTTVTLVRWQPTIVTLVRW